MHFKKFFFVSFFTEIGAIHQIENLKLFLLCLGSTIYDEATDKIPHVLLKRVIIKKKTTLGL